jgi:hypothetical protein
MTLVSVTLAAIFSPALVVLAIRCFFFRPRRPATAEWIPDVSRERYEPMFRLLQEGDIRFLQSQPGATPALVRRVRRQRCRIFRGSLQCLERDFRQTCEALTMLMVQSPCERRDILRTVAVSRVKFFFGMLRVRYRLLLYRWNMGHEPVAQLVRLFEGVQLELIGGLQPALATATRPLS